jgi:hypothetical protein
MEYYNMIKKIALCSVIISLGNSFVGCTSMNAQYLSIDCIPNNWQGSLSYNSQSESDSTQSDSTQTSSDSSSSDTTEDTADIKESIIGQFVQPEFNMFIDMTAESVYNNIPLKVGSYILVKRDALKKHRDIQDEDDQYMIAYVASDEDFNDGDKHFVLDHLKAERSSLSSATINELVAVCIDEEYETTILVHISDLVKPLKSVKSLVG